MAADRAVCLAALLLDGLARPREGRSAGMEKQRGEKWVKKSEKTMKKGLYFFLRDAII